MGPSHLGGESGRNRRRRRPQGWRSLAGPCLLITVVGGALLGFLDCCARQTGLDEELAQTRQQVDQLRAYQQNWYALIGQQKDPIKLRAWADTQGMVYAPAHVDHVQLSQALPPPAEEASPLAALQPPPATVARAPGDSLARAPTGGSPN